MTTITLVLINRYQTQTTVCRSSSGTNRIWATKMRQPHCWHCNTLSKSQTYVCRHHGMAKAQAMNAIPAYRLVLPNGESNAKSSFHHQLALVASAPLLVTWLFGRNITAKPMRKLILFYLRTCWITLIHCISFWFPNAETTTMEMLRRRTCI